MLFIGKEKNENGSRSNNSFDAPAGFCPEGFVVVPSELEDKCRGLLPFCDLVMSEGEGEEDGEVVIDVVKNPDVPDYDPETEVRVWDDVLKRWRVESKPPPPVDPMVELQTLIDTILGVG
jgi:hypothetical protein